ncbi:MAG TPA: hypothetical protein VHF25_15990 [Nitriliruptorales bacterium]|nr:hypothetical protein [Nitriliruptorales bacterium]
MTPAAADPRAVGVADYQPGPQVEHVAGLPALVQGTQLGGQDLLEPEREHVGLVLARAGPHPQASERARLARFGLARVHRDPQERTPT